MLQFLVVCFLARPLLGRGLQSESGSTELRKSLLCGKVESFKDIHFKGEKLAENLKDNEGDK